eukprot:TRINITY_DN31944_c0_g1_i1.p1 TRINITY_DN31944_c0_g1~~TRINITY_DN31944_c0_g1_i1.p1  ORF type:complete len:239 (+),score=12.75 TRINITY_DN31944_c0_g1_i1:47-718(+)
MMAETDANERLVSEPASATIAASSRAGGDSISQQKRRSGRYKCAILLVFVLALILMSRVLEKKGILSVQHFKEAMQQWGSFGIIFFGLMLIIAEVLHIPGFFVVAPAVYVWGPAVGGVATYLFGILACIVSFTLVRKTMGESTFGDVGLPYGDKLLDALDKWPFAIVSALRCVTFLAPGVSYTLAVTPIPISSYVIGTATGLLFSTPICVFLMHKAMLVAGLE